MAQLLTEFVERRHRAWRRGRNLAGPRTVPWVPLAAAACVLLGGALLGANVLRLRDAAPAAAADTDALRAARLQPVVPGARFTVDDTPGVAMLPQPGGAIAVASRMRSSTPQRIDLCRQMADAAGHLLPLRLGQRFADVEAAVRGAGGTAGMRGALLVADASHATAAMPRLRLAGQAGLPLQLTWSGAAARWLGNGGEGIVRGAAGRVTLRDEGWLAWEGGALHLVRRPAAACPRAGELVARLYRPDAAQRGRAQVTAFAAGGASATAWLAPGEHVLATAAAPALEDETLFAALQERGLVRLADDGAIVLAPRDLAAWRAAPAHQRAADLGAWRHVHVDDAAAALLRRLYRQADGSYVRQQVALYNSERALLAWRVRSGDASRWHADGPVTAAMAPQAARLFAMLPQGWQPWTRLAALSSTAPVGRLSLDLPRPATGGEPLALLLAGRVLRVDGATMASRAACDGRACTAPDDVSRLDLRALPGARRIVLTVAPLDARALERPGERQYRHLRVVANRIVWQPLAAPATHALSGQGGGHAAGPVLLADRNGTPLWADGAATAAAGGAGLAPLLGLAPEHDAGIAGMLARPDAGGTRARLSIDLPLQALAQRVLDCVALRRGRWTGERCTGATAPPPQRRAGFVVLDAENGDILAAAGAGQPSVDAGNWLEARALDRANPAGSPLRLPALQHDGGAHHSPGSTFKVISALGLELAARRAGGEARQLDALLSGLPLPAINALARERGFDFATGAPAYPASARGAHVTNYREQGIDGRAREGRLGLAQALTYSLNTWFAWAGELSDRTLGGRAEGGMPDAQPLEAGALDGARPILAAARRLGFDRPLRLDGGLLPPAFRWNDYDALQATPARIDPVHTRHELRQMSIGLRMQATPLQMALAAAAIGQGATVAPRLLLELDGRPAANPAPEKLDVRLDRIRAGMKGVIDAGTAAGAFHALPRGVRAGLHGKTGTAPTSDSGATVWFTGWLEPGSLPGQRHRLAFAVHASHSEGTGGDHAAPAVAAVLAALAGQGRGNNTEQQGK
ncbi:penicillin-binding transpeptidase domain-containing protein [Pseudoduganella sp. SL102]|uniref:penicillin-binding transpeptidase domain-containing protein n=1 Tax=Pseudoduganella sp. SL102 TaxID=2995154 RepID=UPI00248AEC39|nr:penicillin-binding transpeptidase domain-containing protein [Pseudoduganella sp. SL102]WBS05480.1 penicillin-binding transpeptidase domain-containing protein [Pseudoduganella sp. SL102]